jgi:hypothetical protein
MSIPVSRKILIKHAIGRLILDSAHHNCPIDLDDIEGRWLITVGNVSPSIAKDVEGHVNELNLFYFEEHAIEPVLRKWWLYDKDTPIFEYDKAANRLQLSVDTRVSYSNEKAI